MWCISEGIVYGLPPGPSSGAAAPRMARRPKLRLRHAVASRSSHRVTELAQRVRLCHLDVLQFHSLDLIVTERSPGY